MLEFIKFTLKVTLIAAVAIPISALAAIYAPFAHVIFASLIFFTIAGYCYALVLLFNIKPGSVWVIIPTDDHQQEKGRP